MNKTYLGDSVYVEHNGEFIILSTNDGIDETNRIYLEPSVYLALLDYVAKLSTSSPPCGRL